jgi:hypothetical protein
MKSDIDEKLRILQPAIGAKKANQLRQMYYFEDDYRAKREIENYIELMISRFVKTQIHEQIVLPPPPLEICQGEIDIGTVEYMDRPQHQFSLKLKDLNRHTGIFGSTGSGKTTLASNLIRKMRKNGIPFLIFDWEQSYRNLCSEFHDVVVFTLGSDINPLYLNPLNLPPGISQEEYSKSLISLLAEDYLSGAGSDTVLLGYMKTAFQEHNYPTFNDLKEIALRDLRKPQRGRSMLWKETVGRIISSLSIGTAGQVLGSGKHHPLDRLLQKNVVLELSGIQSPRDRKFIIHLIINWIFLWLQDRGIESEQLKQIIIFEEFHNIAMKGKEDNLVGMMFRQARKYGLGLIAIDQTPSEIPNEIYGNMNTKVSFSLSTNRDISAMAKAMNLESRKARYLGMLDTGQAIVNVKQRYSDSFLIRPPFKGQEKNITDRVLKTYMEAFSNLSLTESDIEGNSSRIQSFLEIDTLSPLSKILLQNIAEKPFLPVSQRYKILGISAAQGNDLKRELIEKGFATAHTIDGLRLLDLTLKGSDEVHGLGIKQVRYKGGLEHSYWVNETGRNLRKHGFKPVLEAQDIDISDPIAGIAIEVETGKSDIKKNLAKLNNSRFRECFMLATNKDAEFKIKQITSDYPSIKVLFVKDFLKLTKDQLYPPISDPSYSHPNDEVSGKTK